MAFTVLSGMMPMISSFQQTCTFSTSNHCPLGGKCSYHDNAFVASRALHIANKLNASATYPLLDLFFKYQERYYNKPTRELSRASIVHLITELAARAIGNGSTSAIESCFEDPNTDMATRVSFKYGCSRGVSGTPYFFVNGFLLPDGGSPISYNKWRSIIDPLLKKG